MRVHKVAPVSMKAALMAGPGKIVIQEVRVPEPSRGQVRVRLEGCGVSASNLGPRLSRDRMQFPTTPGGLGREGWGRIDAVGSGVDESIIGQRVTLLSKHAYAEFDIAGEDAVLRLPQSLDNLPFPGEAMGCAMNIFKRSAVQPGDMVAIVGAGFIGLMLVQLCAAAGAEVIAISRRPFSRQLAETAGAAHLIDMEDQAAVIKRVSALTGGRLCDVVIEAVGLQLSLDLAAELTRERGRLVVAGHHEDGPRQINMQLWNWRGLDVINAHERDPAISMQGMRQAIQACLGGLLDVSQYITHYFPLEELDVALHATRDRPPGFLKAAIRLS